MSDNMPEGAWIDDDGMIRPPDGAKCIADCGEPATMYCDGCGEPICEDCWPSVLCSPPELFGLD